MYFDRVVVRKGIHNFTYSKLRIFFEIWRQSHFYELRVQHSDLDCSTTASLAEEDLEQVCERISVSPICCPAPARSNRIRQICCPVLTYENRRSPLKIRLLERRPTSQRTVRRPQHNNMSRLFAHSFHCHRDINLLEPDA